jgi:zinc transport system substrate-binding protein
MLKYLITTTALFATPLTADALRVVADIPPLHSLTAQVMGNIGTPELLTPAGTSPHNHALRPSEAARLQNADLLVWVGPLMSPWLGSAKAEMAPDAASIALMETQGTLLLDKRGAHDHDHDHDHSEEEHTETKDSHNHDHDDHTEHADHDDHADHENHGDDHAEMETDKVRKDAHVWLSPDNAMAWLPILAEELAKLDPANAETYRANAATAVDALKQQVAKTEARLAPLSGGEFLTAHDAYQYFQARFGLTSHAAVSDADDQDAGPAHLRALLTEAPDLGCFVIEPSTPKASVTLVTETLNIPAVTIDGLGAALPLGADHYSALMEHLTSGFESCLSR